ncbi:MAG: protein-glutamate O-methyltransferase CheR [Deltaproteobacteria bacterium]|nr:protein-glutamate O-methyltransferase CheR [Deltaproteobacteria bacterium]
MPLDVVELTSAQFKKICDIVYRFSGIRLSSGKEALVKARLMKRLRALHIETIEAYIRYLESQKGVSELDYMIDAMTTNKTNFFRELAHFNFLTDKILPNLSDRKLRFWSAACSTGEEPYSLAMLLNDKIPGIVKRDVKILATDISATCLEKARRSVYTKSNMSGIPDQYLRKYFDKTENNSSAIFHLKNEIAGMVQVACLNLMKAWPMTGTFNVIFCRNVMIYFDKKTQEKLVNRFWDYIEPGGYLFVGHSEGLSSISHKFTYIQPAVYLKK